MWKVFVFLLRKCVVLLRKFVFRKKMDSVTKTVNSEIWIDCLFIMFPLFPKYLLCQPQITGSLPPRSPQYRTLELIQDHLQGDQEVMKSTKKQFKFIFMTVSIWWEEGLLDFLEALQSLEIRSSFFQIKQDSLMCLKVIFTSCWNISYELFRELTRYFI